MLSLLQHDAAPCCRSSDEDVGFMAADSQLSDWCMEPFEAHRSHVSAAEAPSVLWLQTIKKRKSALRLFKSSEMFLTPAAG